MKIIMNIFYIFVLVALLYLLMINNDKVNLYITPDQPYLEGIWINIVILVSITFGALLGVILTAFSSLKQKNEMRIIKKQNRQLKQELDNLRNISIEEIPDDMMEEPDKETAKPGKSLEEPKQLNGRNE